MAPQSRRHTHDLVSDRPGRSFSSSRAGQRHSFEATHDPHKLKKHKFMVELADMLDDACQRKDFDQLVLVAPHRSLGELRGLLSERVQRRIHKEIARDLAIAPETVKSHVKHIFTKLNVERRAQAVSRAQILGLADAHR